MADDLTMPRLTKYPYFFLFVPIPSKTLNSAVVRNVIRLQKFFEVLGFSVFSSDVIGFHTASV